MECEVSEGGHSGHDICTHTHTWCFTLSVRVGQIIRAGHCLTQERSPGLTHRPPHFTLCHTSVLPTPAAHKQLGWHEWTGPIPEALVNEGRGYPGAGGVLGDGEQPRRGGRLRGREGVGGGGGRWDKCEHTHVVSGGSEGESMRTGVMRGVREGGRVSSTHPPTCSIPFPPTPSSGPCSWQLRRSPICWCCT